MQRSLMLIVIATLAAFGQRIETQKPDRNKVTRLATTLDHLSVIELSEPVTHVAAGSSSYKIEWRENTVFVQPLEPDAKTNLFIWTASGRLSYELVPAESVEQMHFAIDQTPGTVQARREEPAKQPPVVQQASVPTAMLMKSTPVKLVGPARNHQKVEILLKDVYEQGGRVYLRYAIVNGGRKAYRAAAPEVFTLKSPRAPQSLIPLANTQLGSGYQLKWQGEARVLVAYSDFQVPVVRPGHTTIGLIAFELPPSSQPGVRTVVKVAFPPDGSGDVSAVLVL